MNAPIPADLLAALRAEFGIHRLFVAKAEKYVLVSDLIDEIERLRDSARCEAVGKREA